MESRFKQGDRVMVADEDWRGVPKGTTGIVLNNDGFEALWRSVGVDPYEHEGWPVRPDHRIIVISWEQDPEGWPPGEPAFAGEHELEPA
jgi:hypothetical protein